MPPVRASLAEFVGTFALVFVGGGAIIMVENGAAGGIVTVALAHGFILGVMVSATMHISGGQINPAVSIALGLLRKQSWIQAVAFVVAQLLAAVIAALLLNVLFRGVYETGNLGATLGSLTDGKVPDRTAPGIAFVLEAIATFLLMFVILGTIVDPRGVGRSAAIGGFGVGLVVAADILCFGPATGASMNPARSFGPALVAGVWDHHWVYWAGPILGAVLAAFAYKTAFAERAENPAPDR